MIDWDLYEIEKIDRHFRQMLHPSVNLLFFCRNFEQIYPMTISDEVLLPDIFNDITYYTINGVNARYKVLISTKDNEDIAEKLLPERMKQRARRQEAHNKGLDEYYEFMMNEVIEFVEKYPFWKQLIRG